MEKDIYSIGNQKEARVAVLILDKIGSKTDCNKTQRRSRCNAKRDNKQKDITL